MEFKRDTSEAPEPTEQEDLIGKTSDATTSTGIPFWQNHVPSKVLDDDERLK